MLLKDREGMKIHRQDDMIFKESSDKENALGLENAYRFLVSLKDTPFVPKKVSLVKNPGWGYQLHMEYIEETPVTDKELARRYSTRLLLELRKRNIVHGDLTHPNILFRNNIPVVLDWDQSNFAVSEVRPQKRPKPDIVHLMPVLIDKVGDPSRVIQRWQMIRRHLEYYCGWGTFVDLGCCWLDMGALAAADGMKVTGVDNQTIHTDCLEVAGNLWNHYFSPKLISSSLVDYSKTMPRSNVGVLFSTWPYLVRDYSLDIAIEVLCRIISKTDMLFFESQKFLDGPGPEIFKTDEDIKVFLSNFGEVEFIGDIAIPDRNTARSVWKII